MAGVQPGAPKKPWELRYALLTNTTPPWTQPVSMYLLERIGGSQHIWLVCRSALIEEQQTEERLQLPEEAEYMCFEHVDFSQLQPSDEFPLRQPGPMVGAVMFDFLSAEEPAATHGPSCSRFVLASCERLRCDSRSVPLAVGAKPAAAKPGAGVEKAAVPLARRTSGGAAATEAAAQLRSWK